MKRLLTVLLSVFVLCSLAGCSAKPNPNDELVEKYRSIIDALENEDYESVFEEIAMKANEKKEQEKSNLEKVEITLDNFDEYFELVPSFYGFKNNFNEFDSCYAGVGLKVKDAYIDRIYLDTSAVTCDLSYTECDRKCDFDMLTGEVSNVRDLEWSEPSVREVVDEYDLIRLAMAEESNVIFLTKNTLISDGIQVTAWSSSLGSGQLFAGADYYTFYEISDISLNRVTGEIYLK